MGAWFEFAEFPADGIQVGQCLVRGCAIPHPGGGMAYRIDDTDSDTSLVFATDIEWRDRSEAQAQAFQSLCRDPKPANLLIIDAHFGRADAETFAGWGHTCWEDGLAIARSMGMERVILGHHAPDADDQTLKALEQQIKEHLPGAALARAGQWLTIEGTSQSC
jgi:ribonuclease BN (tRNA processing enzyme)